MIKRIINNLFAVYQAIPFKKHILITIGAASLVSALYKLTVGPSASHKLPPYHHNPVVKITHEFCNQLGNQSEIGAALCSMARHYRQLYCNYNHRFKCAGGKTFIAAKTQFDQDAKIYKQQCQRYKSNPYCTQKKWKNIALKINHDYKRLIEDKDAWANSESYSLGKFMYK